MGLFFHSTKKITMAKTIASKYLAILAGCGAFRSVMADPSEDGPETTLENTVVAGAANNYRQYVAVLAYFPEVFDCDNLRDLYTETTTDTELLTGTIATNEDIRSAAADLCWRQSGNQ